MMNYNISLFLKGVDGGWSDYTEWSACSQTCTNKGPGDIARKTRSRTCTNPSPAFGGDECRGIEIDVELCNQEIPCRKLFS